MGIDLAAKGISISVLMPAPLRAHVVELFGLKIDPGVGVLDPYDYICIPIKISDSFCLFQEIAAAETLILYWLSGLFVLQEI